MADNMINSKLRKINDKLHNAPGNWVFEVNSHVVYKEDAYFPLWENNWTGKPHQCEVSEQ